ncbi:MAG: rod shape-determining protein MreD [Thermomicrobiales bacterium]|jgi:rod shape-determining protein MreD|nr:rod shape-determining protein MreD [Thermomicrobiales bacterium]
MVFALLLLFAALVQATVLPSMNVIAVLPDTTLVLLLVWCALRGMPEGLIWAFGLGLLLDVISLDPFGANGLGLLGVAVLGGLARRRFFHSNLIVPIVVAVAATFVHAFVLLLIRSAEGSGLPLAAVMRVVFLQALLNSIFVPPLYLIAGMMDRWMVPSHA